jgi:hypothetical protein
MVALRGYLGLFAVVLGMPRRWLPAGLELMGLGAALLLWFQPFYIERNLF